MVQNRTEKIDDQVIAADLLLAAKNGVRTYSYAITEAHSPAVRSVLKRQLDDAISFHQQVADYMTNKEIVLPS